MNKQWMIFHLSEASEAIDKLMETLASEDEIGAEVMIDFEHVYPHIKTA